MILIKSNDLTLSRSVKDKCSCNKKTKKKQNKKKVKYIKTHSIRYN
jgi:hypothetical protein